MALLKTARAYSAVPSLGHVLSPPSSALTSAEPSQILVVGHRGCGMNSSPSSDVPRENSIRSFNLAATHLPFVELDVQVTADGFPVIFHDSDLLFYSNSGVNETRVADISLQEFLSLGYSNKRLLRRSAAGEVYLWDSDDGLCTLQEAFENVNVSVGFNIELKFDDEIIYTEAQLVRFISAVFKVVNESARDRQVIFSSFHPDAAKLARSMQSTYPVLFLTDAGCEVTYKDERRNSMEAAVRVCLEYGLQGIVAEARAVMERTATAMTVVRRVKELGFVMLTYGEMNNEVENVRRQRELGIDGVIVDNVREIAKSVLEEKLLFDEPS